MIVPALKFSVALFLGHIALLRATYFSFRVSRRRREMYSGHARLCVCLCVCGSPHSHTILHGPGCNLGEW